MNDKNDRKDLIEKRIEYRRRTQLIRYYNHKKITCSMENIYIKNIFL